MTLRTVAFAGAALLAATVPLAGCGKLGQLVFLH